MRADAFCDLAEVLELAGRPEGATHELERYRQKGVEVMVPRVQARLAGLGADST